MSYDFHTHSTFSDGTLEPENLISLAFEKGIKVISVTDHDTIANYSYVSKACKKYDIELIKGIELSSQLNGNDIHILAYFENENDYFKLKSLEEIQKKSRLARIFHICEKLKEINVFIEPEKIISNSEKAGSVGRPQVARELVIQGYVSDIPEAFDKYLAAGKQGYISSTNVSTSEVISTVKEFNGVPVLAHPGVKFMNKEESIKELIDYGLEGIEVYYPSHDYYKFSYYLNLARKYKLIATGGSDFHGPNIGKEDRFGKIKIPEAEYLRLKEKIKSL